MDRRHPPAEVHIDAELVTALLEQQLPHLNGGELTLVDEGWDNVTYRTGSDYAVRIPRRKVAVEAWMLFDSARGRALCLEAYAPSERVRARAAGWAVHFASGLIDRQRAPSRASRSGGRTEAGWRR